MTYSVRVSRDGGIKIGAAFSTEGEARQFYDSECAKSSVWYARLSSHESPSHHAIRLASYCRDSAKREGATRDPEAEYRRGLAAAEKP